MDDSKNLKWFKVEEDSMPVAVKAKWAALQKANAAQRAAREEFEASFLAAAKKAERVEGDVALAFGYRFGGLAIAKVDPAAKVTKATAKPKFSF